MNNETKEVIEGYIYYAAIDGEGDVFAVGTTYIEAEGCTTIEFVTTQEFDFDRIAGYVLTDDNRLIFDEEKWSQYLTEREIAERKAREKEAGEALLYRLTSRSILSMASDEEAYIMRYQYEGWGPDADYEEGDRRLYGDNLYKCRQDHTSQSHYPPDIIPALWDIISKEASGTKDDPIPVPENFSSMVYIKGKYYLEDGVLYFMSRDGMQDGEEISLDHKPSQLIDIYFTVV